MTIVLKIENTNGPGGDKAVIVRTYEGEYLNGDTLEAGESCEVTVYEGRMIQIDEVNSERTAEPEPVAPIKKPEPVAPIESPAPVAPIEFPDPSAIGGPNDDPKVVSPVPEDDDALDGVDVPDEAKSGLKKLFG